jgi:hypothetical protein
MACTFILTLVTIPILAYWVKRTRAIATADSLDLEAMLEDDHLTYERWKFSLKSQIILEVGNS